MRPAWTTFGVPETEEDLLELISTPEHLREFRLLVQPKQRLEELYEQAKRDLTIVKAGGRWVPGRDDPTAFVPGDVVALRFFPSGSSLEFLSGEIYAGGNTGLARAGYAEHHLLAVSQVLRAAPFFLPVGDATGIMNSHPPERPMLEELRLPFPVVSVYFGADLEIPRELTVWPANLDDPDRRRRLEDRALRLRDQLSVLADDERFQQDVRAAVGSQRTAEQLIENVKRGPGRARMDPLWAMREFGGFLTGVTLLAGPGGVGLSDEVHWTVASNPDPEDPTWPDGDRVRAVMTGRLSRSILRPLVENVAAAVGWAHWLVPRASLPLTEELGSRMWRKKLKRNVYQQDERKGVLGGVRVLDVGKHQAEQPRSGAAGAGAMRASPVTHNRRGHWRRVRVGPRDDFTYRPVYIPFTVVNPRGTRSDAVTVYRLPTPQEALARVESRDRRTMRSARSELPADPAAPPRRPARPVIGNDHGGAGLGRSLV
jgi:hypothetical protein